jgi:hypothetical protein
MATPCCGTSGSPQLRAEAAVLARDPGAARHLAQAKTHADRNPIARPHPSVPKRSCGYASSSSPGNGERATGEGELVRMGATPMAAFR